MKNIILMLLLCISITAQTTLQTVDFEIDGNGYSVSPAESNTNTSNPDYWIRTNGSVPAIFPSNSFSNMHGDYFFTGEDLDFDSGVTEFYVTCDAVSIDGYENLQIKLLIGGAGNGYNKEGEEYLKIQYQIDGGGYTTLAQFLGNGNFYTEDADVDGNPDTGNDLNLDATDINTSLKEFTYNIPTIGTSLQVRIKMYNGGSEELAFDYIRVSGDVATPVELTNFTASAFENSIVLNWQTATEVNNHGFEIERCESQNVRNEGWKIIGFVSGYGNSNSPKDYSFTDQTNKYGEYSYRLKQIDNDGCFKFSNVLEVKVESPTKFTLNQNYPNPFNPTTSIQYSVPSTEYVSLKVYDVLGNEIATLVNETKQPGTYQVTFDASNLTSGVYFYRINSGSFSSVRKLMLVK